MKHFTDNIPIWTEDYKVLTQKQLSIPGLYMIAYRNLRVCAEELDMHYHHTMEFVVMLKGKNQFMTNNKLHTIYGGDIFTTLPEEPHRGAVTPQTICEFVWFQFDLSSPENFLGLPPTYSQYVFEQLKNYNCKIKKAHNKDLPLLKDAFFLLASNDLQKKILGYNYFIHFVVNNLCHHDMPAKPSNVEHSIQDAISYINSHLMEDLTVDSIAQYINLSLSHFKVEFKKYTGMTPHAYITSLRIDTAKILLKSPPEYSITQIAYMLNFSSTSHFTAVFKKHTGVTPSEFKNMKYNNEL